MNKQALWFTLLSTLLISCANTSNPTGGEGDKTPPRVVSTSPISGTTAIETSAEIELRFSEWIDPKSAEQGIQISPKVDSGVTISVRGRTVTVRPNSSWQKDRTYHISTNSELLDYSRNALDSVTDLVFSTGSSLDKGYLSGRINKSLALTSRPKVGLYLEEHLNNIDTTLITSFDYITQCDSLGYFHFDNIAEASYKIIAFIDDDANNTVTPKETIFLSSVPIVKANNDSLHLLQGSSDTTAIKLGTVKPIHPKLLLYTLEEFHPHRDQQIQATIRNKNGDTLAENLPYTLSDDSSFLWLDIPIALEQIQYELLTQIPKPFIDTTGLSYYVDTTLFNGITQIDSTVPEITAVKKITEKTRVGFSVSWSTPMLIENDTVFLKDTLDTPFPFTAERGIKQTVHYRSSTDLPTEVVLSVLQKEILAKTVSGISSEIDTTDTTKITVKTLSRDVLAHSLSIIVDSMPVNGLLHLTGIKTSTEYLLPMSSDTLVITNPLAGKYSVAYHVDKNENGKKDQAILFPFSPGEATTYLSDTITIPPRWEVEHALSIKSKPRALSDSTATPTHIIKK